MSSTVYENAKKLRAKGRHVIPLHLDGSKSPTIKKWQTRTLTDAEFEYYFGHGQKVGYGIVHGIGFGEVLDHDPKEIKSLIDLFDDWKKAVEQKAPGLLDCLPIVETPSGGHHVYWLHKEPESGKKLSRVYIDEKRDDFVCVFETRGKGMQTVGPDNPVEVHPSKKPYRLISRVRIEDAPFITNEERKVLLNCARAFNNVVEEEKPTRPVCTKTDEEIDTLPGSIFIRSDKVSIGDLLEKHGWTRMGYSYWQRPGKDGVGSSAEVKNNDDGTERFCQYSSNAEPFECKTYNKFQVYTLLEYGRDDEETRSAAGKELRKLGYCKKDEYEDLQMDFDKTIQEMQDNSLSDFFSDKASIEDCRAIGSVSTKPEQTKDRAAKEPENKPVEKSELSQTPLFDYLLKGNHKRLSDEHIQRRVKSTKEVLELIPKNSFITDYLAYAMPTTDAPVMFHVAAALAIVAYLINRKAWVSVGGSRLYPLLWIGIIAQSSKDRKSSSIGIARNLLQDDPDYSNVIPDSATLDALINELGIELPKDIPLSSKPPSILEQAEARNKKIASARLDCTFARESAAANGKEFTKGVGLFYANELSSLMSNLQKNHNLGGKTILTEWFDCPKEWTKTTKTQGSCYIPNPFVPIFGASTIEWFAQSCEESDLMGGFLARWLFFTNYKRDFLLSLRDEHPAGMRETLLDAMEKIKGYRGEVTLSVEAEAFYWDWRQDIETGCKGAIASWVARLGDYAFKIALLYEAVTSGELVISRQNLELACRLIEQIKDNLIVMLERDLAFSEDDRQMKKILRHLRERGGEMGHSPLLKTMNMDAKEFQSLMNTLILREQVICKVEVIPANGSKKATYRLKGTKEVDS